MTVAGRGTPAIYIDGRPMRDVSELRSLQSSDIRKVELVMAPGAQYESTTKAVLRITTRRNFSQGLSVSDVAEVQVRRRCWISVTTPAPGSCSAAEATTIPTVL